MSNFEISVSFGFNGRIYKKLKWILQVQLISYLYLFTIGYTINLFFIHKNLIFSWKNRSYMWMPTHIIDYN